MYESKYFIKLSFKFDLHKTNNKNKILRLINKHKT